MLIEDKDNRDLNGGDNSRSVLRDTAEEKLSKLQDATQNLKDKTFEEIIHELQVHQIELELQNEELKRIQLELEESRDNYQELYDFSPVGYFTLSSKGIIRDVNLTGASLLGIPRPKLLHTGFGRFVAREYEDQWYQHLIAVLGQEEKQTCDLTLRREHGSSFSVCLESVRMDAPVGQQAENGAIHVVVRMAVSDITQRKAAEESLKRSKEELELRVEERTAELKESRDRFQDLVENTPDWVWEIDEKGVYTYVSPRVQDILGYEPQEVLNRTPFDLMDPEEAHRVSDIFAALAAFRKPVMGLENTNLHRNGHAVVLETNVVPFFSSDGTLRGYRGINRDITERNRLEAERLEMERTLLHAQKLESLSVLAGRISHDFNNQLAVVLGNLELALTDLSPDSVAKESIMNAIEAADRSVELSLQMLIYSGSAFYLPQDIHVNELLNRTSDLLKSSVSKHVDLKLEIGDTLPPIKGDVDQIQRLVTSILDNAFEAIGNKEGAVRLSTGVLDCDEAYLSHNRLEMKPEPGQFVFLEITDTGCGMDAETLRKLFDPFFTTKSNSRGLGMSEVMGIAKGHHGALFVVSQLGKGTTVQVLFPVSNESQASSLSDRESVETKSSAPGVPSRGKTILLVDDEEGVRDLTVRRLNVLGYDTITAADGAQGVRILRERLNEIDLVILDFAMPRMDGLEAFEELIRIKPDVKVILCSGYTEDAVLRSFTGQHAAAVLHKPYKIEDLKGKLDRLLGTTGQADFKETN
ncbi:MAG: PAS domain S-box protein [Desulfomonilaceae bacterium]